MTKMTNKIALEIALTAIAGNGVAEYRFAGKDEVFSAEEAKAKLMKMMEQLDKKASAEKKPTQKQKEAAQLAADLLNELRDAGKAMTVSEMIAELPCCSGLSNQKVSAMVRALGAQVERIEEKRKAYFKAVA